MIPDRVDGAPDGRDMVAMRKHRISLFRNAHAAEFARQVGEIRYFDAGNIVVVAGVIAIAADAVRDLSDPARKILDGLVEALPLPGNGGAGLPGVTLPQAGDEKRLAGLETRRLEIID